MKRVLLVLFLCLAVIAFFGCKKEEKKVEKTKETTEVKKTDEDMIKDTANKYFDALKKSDVAGYKSLLTDDSVKAFDATAEKAWTENLKKNVVTDCSYKESKIEGEKATVTFMAKVKKANAEAEEPRTVEMAKVKDAWMLVFTPPKK